MVNNFKQIPATRDNKWNIWAVILAAIAIVVSIIIAWWNNYEKSTSLNIEKFSETLLTQPLDVDGLTANYIFHDSIKVDNLWRTTFIIRNTGETTIYGGGFNERNTRTDLIPFTVSGCNRILSVNISSCNNAAVLNKQNSLHIHQWRPGEFVELVFLTEGEQSPNISISDREIIDSSITYSTYSPETNQKDSKLIDAMPNVISDGLKWCYTIILAFIGIGIIFTLPVEVRKQPTRQMKIITLLIWLTMTVLFASPILWMF